MAGTWWVMEQAVNRPIQSPCAMLAAKAHTLTEPFVFHNAAIKDSLVFFLSVPRDSPNLMGMFLLSSSNCK
jgi:hypothetical protein